MTNRLRLVFVLVLLLAAACAYVAAPKTVLLKLGSASRDNSLRQGLDLKGGVHLVYEADTAGLAAKDVGAALDGARTVFENRVNALGATEPDIRLSQLNGKPSIVIDLPGLQNVEQAKELLGKTAKLTFSDEAGATVLEGKDVVPDATTAEPLQQQAQGGFGAGTQWQVKLVLTPEGKQKFAAATAENIGKRIAISLDGQLISAPTVNTAITDGTAIITGNFTVDSARAFAQQLKSGALPVPVKLVQEQTVGASLGADAIARSLFAGLAGIFLVFLFIILVYRWPGVLACLSLTVYMVLNVAFFKLFRVTLTLAGIAAFIISVGIAVDTNVLTFERLKEELRGRNPLGAAISDSFKRSWTSIRDSHLSQLISASIIFLFAAGSVRGFALVLIIGTLLSLFTAITVTRNWMLLLAGSRLSRLLELR